MSGEKDPVRRDVRLYYLPRPPPDHSYTSSSEFGERDPFYEYPAKNPCHRPCIIVGLALLVILISTNIILIYLVLTGSLHSVTPETKAAALIYTNESMSGKFLELEEEIAENKLQIAALKELGKHHDASLVKLGADVSSMRTEITNVASKLSKQGSSVAQLNSDVRGVQDQVKGLQTKASQIEARIASVQSTLEGEINNVRATIDVKCACCSTSGGSSLHASVKTHSEPLTLWNAYIGSPDVYGLQTVSRMFIKFLRGFNILDVNLLPVVSCLVVSWF